MVSTSDLLIFVVLSYILEIFGIPIEQTVKSKGQGWTRSIPIIIEETITYIIEEKGKFIVLLCNLIIIKVTLKKGYFVSPGGFLKLIL
jgi:hypothetical protein